VPNALLTYLQAQQKMNEEAAPRDNNRTIVYSPGMESQIIDTLKGLFQQSTAIAGQYEKGQMGRAIGADWYMDQNVKTQTIGALGGTPVVDGANQTGSSILTSGWTANAAILNAGDIIYFASVYAVNPQSFQSTGSLRGFVVTSNVTANGSGVATIPISANSGLGIVTSGPFQNVTAAPANNAAITIFGTANTATPQGLAFHKEAFAFACADLYEPKGVDMAARMSDDQLGMSIRMVRAYDINTDRTPCRTDILYGVATLYPELACRIAS
jgi:hypothetical protein